MKIFRTAWPLNILLTFLLLCGINISAQETEPFSLNKSPLPAPTELVNDFAGVLDEATKTRLNALTNDFKNKTNPPVVLAVAIVRTTGDRPIEDYSLAVARGWKIGSKLDDNPSALLFIAVDDRRYFTQVSKDLQDELPDGLAGQLQRQYLVPALKQGNYNKGVTDTLEAYIRTIEQRTGGTTSSSPAKEQTQPTTGKSGFSFSGIVCCLIILVIILFIIFSRSSTNKRNGRDRDRWGGGGFGGSGGGGGWIFLPGGSWGGSGDSSSSSSWGGGSSSSDWGGFGGGDFDGGGAGGDW